MRDELGGQVKKAFRGSASEPGDSWATATTEPPHAADEAPECAWCPVCRAARRISRARDGAEARGGPKISDAADVMAAAVKEALSGIDSILSYRPPPAGPRQSSGTSGTSAAPGQAQSADAADTGPADDAGAGHEAGDAAADQAAGDDQTADS